MAAGLFQNPQGHIDAGPVISADSLGRHQDRPVPGAANIPYRLMVYGIQMGHQQYRQRTWGIEVPVLGNRRIPSALQFCGKCRFQFGLCKTQDLLQT